MLNSIEVVNERKLKLEHYSTKYSFMHVFDVLIVPIFIGILKKVAQFAYLLREKKIKTAWKKNILNHQYFKFQFSTKITC